jgi:anti-sigma factor RsiW
VTCRDVRELADSFLGDQLLVETMHEIVRHLETCPACREEFEARRLLRKRLQTAIDTAPNFAPRPAFVSALTARLHPVETAGGMTRRAWLETALAAAAGFVALVSGGLFARSAWRHSRMGTLAASAAGDHQNCAIRFNLRERPISLEEAATRFDPAYARLTSIPAPASSTVLDRHSCVFEGRRFGHIVFRYHDRVVSLLVTSGDGSGNREPTIVQSRETFNVASFDVGAHSVFIVSDLPAPDTLTIAQVVSDPVRKALERG